MWVQKIVIFGQCLVVNWKRYKIRAQYYGTATQKNIIYLACRCRVAQKNNGGKTSTQLTITDVRENYSKKVTVYWSS